MDLAFVVSPAVFIGLAVGLMLLSCLTQLAIMVTPGIIEGLRRRRSQRGRNMHGSG
jgi:hypothetical protein